ncbi:carboxylesterase type B [Desulfitobacterium dichloroeliminans LMG P-21439]|uniref:Carboxylic ester hydrolase n=1 Tax=Desulfitobacterium dichloroeliminans (strain LMG P-21439 / DCA1) TaxID=871963 RepID=L0FAT0_DESDL|nr:carboxylesterase/lipase family protein [Desulfitobacterium dichloroeliminans]AGA70120.1 carboxylesterase type B [Desulfitobacterium dichloroeliminans LMG P-21439]
MSTTLVKTRFGMVEGRREGRVSIWRGIPYAAPPLNSRRFRPPQEPESWAGVREAKEFGPASLQGESPSMIFLSDSPVHKNEDCLYLNIWSPGADDKRRPVMVWIHGGSFMYGSGSSHLYDGKSFAEQGDVVIVTLNYRLGVFGFLHLSDIGDEEYRGSGNCGLLDQVAALKWVKENIEGFGGDPNNITIFGESAGAVSVGNLLSMPMAKGLFQKAILQSGTARCKVALATATKMTEQLLSELQADKQNLTALQTIPAEKILKAIEIFPRRALGPVGDGIIISEQPEKVLYEGFAKDIPVLVGTNADENALFSYFDPAWKQMDEHKIKLFFEQTFGSSWTNISQYFAQEEALTKASYEDAMTHYVFTYPAIYFSEGQARHGAPVWMYRFDYGSRALGGELKAFHGLEIPFVWNTLLNPATEKITGKDADRYRLAELMHRAWIAFAHQGDPNNTTLPNWPLYDEENRATMLFNTNNEVINDPNGQKRLSWKEIFA